MHMQVGRFVRSILLLLLLLLLLHLHHHHHRVKGFDHITTMLLGVTSTLLLN
jgi:hypothetical protein